jgi:hypothetical protein
MAIALRSVRFLDGFTSLEIRECADRSMIQLVVETASDRTAEPYMMTLTASEWCQLTSLPYVDRSKCTEPPPKNVVETFTLVDEQMSVEVRERADRAAVVIVVNGGDDLTDAAAFIELSAEQWEYLRRLDYTTRLNTQQNVTPRLVSSPDAQRGSVH